MASADEVEAILLRLVNRLSEVDPTYRSMLPSRRTIQVECPDIDAIYHARLRNGQLNEVVPGPIARPDIRVRVDSDDLVLMANGELSPSRAYASERLSIQASVTDLLRLRAVL